jgi:glycosyltransferase involved in cell wall biosynthesis
MNRGNTGSLRVLVDTNILRRPSPGTGRWVRGLTSALTAHPDLQIITAAGPARLGPGRTGRARPGLRGWFVRLPNAARERWWYEVGISRVAARESADVLLMPANLSARRGRIPQVVAVLDVNFLTQPDTYEPAAARYMAWGFRRAVRNASRLITISEFSRSEICRYLGADPDRVTVVYPGVDTPPAISDPAPPLDRQYALWVGATEVSKNVGLLLHAWAAGPPNGLALVIVGPPGRDHSSLSERAATLGPEVVIRGQVDDAELERWYRHAAVFLFPSRTEGFGYPPVEAMRRGVPVVAARAGPLPEVLGDAALFHDPDDPDELRGQIGRVLADQALRADMICRGLERAASYSWDRAAREVAAVLRAAVAADLP